MLLLLILNILNKILAYIELLCLWEKHRKSIYSKPRSKKVRYLYTKLNFAIWSHKFLKIEWASAIESLFHGWKGVSTVTESLFVIRHPPTAFTICKAYFLLSKIWPPITFTRCASSEESHKSVFPLPKTFREINT